jgi:hypothetical protein
VIDAPSPRSSRGEGWVRGSLDEHSLRRGPLTRSLRLRPLPASGARYTVLASRVRHGGYKLPRPALCGERVGVRGSLDEHNSRRVPLTRSLRLRPFPTSGARYSKNNARRRARLASPESRVRPMAITLSTSDHLAPLAGRGRRAAPGEGDSRRGRTRGESPSPGFSLRKNPTSPRTRGEVQRTRV